MEDLTLPPTPEELRLMEMGDRIERYLRGQMSKEEEQSFLDECKKDPELKREAYFTALLYKAANRGK